MRADAKKKSDRFGPGRNDNRVARESLRRGEKGRGRKMHYWEKKIRRNKGLQT